MRMLTDWTMAIGAASMAADVGMALIAWRTLILQKRMNQEIKSSQLRDRVDVVERALAGMPTPADTREIFQRIGHVETSVASVQATVNGLDDKIDGLGRQTDLITKHLLGNKE